MSVWRLILSGCVCCVCVVCVFVCVFVLQLWKFVHYLQLHLEIQLLVYNYNIYACLSIILLL